MVIKKCSCNHCSEMVNTEDFTYPECSRCYADIDGKCSLKDALDEWNEKELRASYWTEPLDSLK